MKRIIGLVAVAVLGFSGCGNGTEDGEALAAEATPTQELGTAESALAAPSCISVYKEAHDNAGNNYWYVRNNCHSGYTVKVDVVRYPDSSCGYVNANGGVRRFYEFGIGGIGLADRGLIICN